MDLEIIFKNSITNYWRIIYSLGFILIIGFVSIVGIVKYTRKYNVSVFDFLYSGRYILSHLTVFGVVVLFIVIYSLVTVIISGSYYYFNYLKLKPSHTNKNEYYGFSLYYNLHGNHVVGTFVLVNDKYPSQHNEEEMCDNDVFIRFNELCSLYYHNITGGDVKIERCKRINNSFLQYCAVRLNPKDSILVHVLADGIVYRENIGGGLKMHTGYGIFEYFEPGYVNKVIVKDIKCLPYVKQVFVFDTVCLSSIEFFTCYNSIHLPISFDKYFIIDFVPHCFAYYRISDENF